MEAQPRLLEGIPLSEWQQFSRAMSNLEVSLKEIEGEKIIDLGPEVSVNVGTPDDRINKISQESKEQLQETLAAFETDSFKVMMSKLDDKHRKPLEGDIIKAKLYLEAFKSEDNK